MRATLFTSTFLALSVLCLAPAPSHALDQADADRLKAVVTRNVNDMKNQVRSGGGDIKTTGEVTSVSKGNYIAATYPDMLLINKTKTSIDMGAIALNAAPAPTAGQWLMSYALPTPIITYGKDGKESSRITFGKQDVRGVYDQKAEIYTASDIDLVDMVIKPTGAAEEVRIGQIAAHHKLTPKDANGNLIDITMTGSMTGLTFPASLADKFAAAPLLPTKFAFGMDGSNIPQAEVANLQRDMAKATTPEARTAVQKKLTTLYQANKSVFKITQMSMAGADYTVNFTGSAFADASARAGYVMNGKITINGLQALQTKLTELPTKTQQEKEGMMKVAAGMLMAQTYLKKGEGDVFTLDLSIDKAGTVMVNGVDRTADLGQLIKGAMAGGMSGGMSGAAPAAPAKPKPAM